MGEQHDPLSTICRFTVLSQNDMFKYRQGEERKRGGQFLHNVGAVTAQKQLRIQLSLFYFKNKIHFLEKTCGKDYWTACSLIEYMRRKALGNAVVALRNHVKSLFSPAGQRPNLQQILTKRNFSCCALTPHSYYLINTSLWKNRRVLSLNTASQNAVLFLASLCHLEYLSTSDYIHSQHIILLLMQNKNTHEIVYPESQKLTRQQRD